MGILDTFLKPYQNDGQPACEDASLSRQFVENVEKGVSTTSTNTQPFVIFDKMAVNWPDKVSAQPQGAHLLAPKKLAEFMRLDPDKQNVENVACVRESESANLTSFSHKNTPIDPSPVGSLTRACNILNILPDCDSCPACGHWDGYGRMGSGRYCFFSAMFKGKTARPVLIAEARKDCPKNDDPDFGEI